MFTLFTLFTLFQSSSNLLPPKTILQLEVLSSLLTPQLSIDKLFISIIINHLPTNSDQSVSFTELVDPTLSSSPRKPFP